MTSNEIEPLFYYNMVVKGINEIVLVCSHTEPTSCCGGFNKRIHELTHEKVTNNLFMGYTMFLSQKKLQDAKTTETNRNHSAAPDWMLIHGDDRAIRF